MTLYHGTNQDFDEIDLSKSNAFKDFGKGFYLTDIKQQAEAMSLRKTRIFGGYPILQSYYFDESLISRGILNVLSFDGPNKEWAEFIYKNRSIRETPFTHGYDLVIGPIADDGVAYLLNRYDEGTLSIDDLVKGLEYKKLNKQYFFGTYKAINFLRRIR